MRRQPRIYQTVPTTERPEPRKLKFGAGDAEPSTCNSHPPTRFRVQLPDNHTKVEISRVGGADVWICGMCGGWLLRDGDGFRAMTPDDYRHFYEAIQRRFGT